jgi:predicted nuclease of predicted toxin-antitoxin system
VKFLVDAQLPWRLAVFLSDAGHDVVHTRELVEGKRTSAFDEVDFVELRPTALVLHGGPDLS